jgi:MFS family permease
LTALPDWTAVTDAVLRAPQRTRTDPVLARWRNAVLAVFAMSGFVFASWAARVPNIRDLLGATTREMGVLIFGIAIGAIVGLLASSHVIARTGASTAIRWFLGTAALGLIGAGLIAGLAPDFWILMLFLAVLGAGNAILDVAMNLSAAANERRIGKTLMPMFHAAFSLGTMLGAGTGALTEQLGVPVAVHLGGVGAFVIAAGLYAGRFLQPAEEPRVLQPGERAGWRSRLAAWTDVRVLLIGLIVLGMAFTEGTANDWLGLAMVDGYGLSNPGGAAVFGVFVTAVPGGRLWGGGVLGRFF